MNYIKKTILVNIFLLMFISLSFGAGFHVNVEQGMKAMGMGGAFVGLADDPTALYYNPAGITQLKAKTNFAATYTFGVFHPRLHSPKIVDKYGITRLTDSTKEEDWRWAQIPSFYFTHRINDKITVGFAFFAPFGTATDWTHTWIGRYFADKTDLKTYDFNPTIAYKINEKLTVAAGINYVYSTVTIKNSTSYPFLAFDPHIQKALGFSLTPASQLSLYNRLYNRNYDVDVKLDGDTGSSGRGWGFNIGILYKPNDEWQIGAIYRSEVDLDFEGHATYTYMPGIKTLGAEVGIPQLSAIPLLQKSKIKASIKLPDYAAIGIVNKSFKNWTLLFDLYWTGWSDYKDLTVKFEKLPYKKSVPKNWNDVIAIRLGAQYQYNNWAFRFGYMHDESPTTDSTRGPELACSDRNDATFGIGYKYKKFNIDLAYLIAFFKNKQSKLVDEQTGTQLKGRWSTIAHVIGVTMSYEF